MVERYRRRKGNASLLGSHQKCWLWGRHVVLETLRAARWPVLELHVSEQLPKEDLQFTVDFAMKQEHFDFIKCSPERLTQLCHSREHQGFLAKMGPFPYDRVEDVLAAHVAPALVAELISKLPTPAESSRPQGPGLQRAPLFGILDGLQDPLNFGAVIRSAHVLGVDALFVPSRGQVEVTALVARSSAGAVNHLPIAQADDLLCLAEQLRSAGIRLIGTSPLAPQSAFACDLKSAIAIVVGNEGSGVRSELLDACDELVTIPQFGAIESLNAAVAAGILFYEAQRQRAEKAVGRRQKAVGRRQ